MQAEFSPLLESVLCVCSQKQEPFLSDLSPSDKPWDVHRAYADLVAGILEQGLEFHQRQALRIHQCAEHLEFGWVVESLVSGEVRLKLKEAWFCRVRACPVCQWRRARMWVARFIQAFPNIYRDHPYLRYAFLTLTVRNCPVSDLREEVRAMNAAWKRLIERRAWPALGFVRSLEVTRSDNGFAHPHFHVLLALEPSYFCGRRYLSTAKWAELWREALRVDYAPICDVRVVRPRVVAERGLKPPLVPSEGLISAITEVVKYTVKPSDMVVDPHWLLTIADQLRNCRAVAVGGILKRYLNDGEPEDLIHVEDADLDGNVGGVHFGWRDQLQRYQRKSPVR